MTTVLLDKKADSDLKGITFDEMSFKDSVDEFENQNKKPIEEKAGPNYFLVGGPYPNYQAV